MSTIYSRVASDSDLQKTQLSYCAACPKLCRHTCPVAEAEKRETVTPWGLMSMLYLEDQGYLALSPDDAALTYHCTSCHACQGTCKYHNDVPATLHSRRAQLFAQHEAPYAVNRMVSRFEARAGCLHDRKASALIRDSVPETLREKKSTAMVFLDCVSAAKFPSSGADLATVVSLLEIADVSFAADQPACCGMPLYDAGASEQFADHAHHVKLALEHYSRLYVSSPGCAWLMRDIYPTVGATLKAEVHPTIDLVTPVLDRIPLAKKQGPATVFHHPCHLARPLGRVGEPLQLLEHLTGRAPRLPFRNGEQTSCSGGGGGLPLILPEVAEEVASNLLNKLHPLPDEWIVTACPSSQRRLQKAASQPVFDLMSMLATHLKEHFEV